MGGRHRISICSGATERYGGARGNAADESYKLVVRAFIDNPSQGELRRMTAEMPNARSTAFGNLDVLTRVNARSTAGTYIVSDELESLPGSQMMSRTDYDAIARRRAAPVREQEMIIIDGDISNAAEVRTPAQHRTTTSS